MPPEEHTLFSATVVAKTYLDHGWTSCVGAAAAKPRLDVVMRNAIDARLDSRPALPREQPGDRHHGRPRRHHPPHVDVRELSFGWVVTGPEEMRKAVRMFIKYGVDLIKLNLSGEEMTDTAAQETSPMDDEEIEPWRCAKRSGAACASAPMRAPPLGEASASATASRSSTTPSYATRNARHAGGEQGASTSSRRASAGW